MEALYLGETGARKGNIRTGQGNQLGFSPSMGCLLLVILDGRKIVLDLGHCLDERYEVEEIPPEPAYVGDLEEDERLGFLGKTGTVEIDT